MLRSKRMAMARVEASIRAAVASTKAKERAAQRLRRIEAERAASAAAAVEERDAAAAAQRAKEDEAALFTVAMMFLMITFIVTNTTHAILRYPWPALGMGSIAFLVYYVPRGGAEQVARARLRGRRPAADGGGDEGWWRWMRSLIVCMGGALILELLIIARDEVTLDAGR